MDISFIILTWNSEKHIEICLKSIFHAYDNTNTRYEIFIVDNGSTTDRTVDVIKRFHSQHSDIIKPTFLPSNKGTTYSRNLALKQCSGDYVVVMDSDVEINPDTTATLINSLEKNTDVGLISPKLVYATGNLQKSTDHFPTLWRKFYRYFFLKKIEEREHKLGLPQKLIKVDYAISAFWMIRKDAIKKVGILDEKIFYAPEDVDYCLRVWKSGYHIGYEPRAYAIHDAQEISRGFKINKATIEHIKGLAYYFFKHRYLFVKPKFF